MEQKASLPSWILKFESEQYSLLKNQITLVTLCLFPSFFFSLTKYLVLIFFIYILCFYVQSMYRIYSKWYMSSVSFVSCVALFYLLLFLIYF